MVQEKPHHIVVATLCRVVQSVPTTEVCDVCNGTLRDQRSANIVVTVSGSQHQRSLAVI